MKNFLKLTLLSSLLIFTYSCEKTLKKNSGKIKSYTRTSYLAIEKNGVITKDKKAQERGGVEDEKVRFDKKGNIIEKISCNSDSICTQTKFKYDNKNNPIEKIVKKRNTEEKTVKIYDNNKHIKTKEYLNNKLISLKEMSYDKNGKINKEEYSITDSISSRLMNKNIFVYDNSGKLTETFNHTITYDTGKMEDSEYEKTTNNYDSIGNLISILYCNHDNSFIDKISYTYDDKKNKTSYINYDEKDSVASKIIYEYNERNKEIKYIEFDSKLNIIKKDSSCYDNRGNKIEYHTFGKFNNVVEKFIYNKKNELVEYSIKEYGTKTKKNEYDEFGNIIKTIKFEDGKPTYIIETVYEFY